MIQRSCEHLSEIRLRWATKKWIDTWLLISCVCTMDFLILVSFISIFCLFFRLKSLTYLSINHNQLASIPRELCFLENLSELQLNYNQLICIPEEIKFLKMLQKLLLVRNNIDILPEVRKTWKQISFCWRRTYYNTIGRGYQIDLGIWVQTVICFLSD